MRTMRTRLKCPPRVRWIHTVKNAAIAQIQNQSSIYSKSKWTFDVTPGGVPFITAGSQMHPRTFKDRFYNQPSRPLLVKEHAKSMPAIQKWFLSPDDSSHTTLMNKDYFKAFGDLLVPVEVTRGGVFNRAQMALDTFLQLSTDAPLDTDIYLAQCSIDELSPELRADLPIPRLAKAGMGDLYNSSIWIGRAPTYTPLHRDPNDNILVQLAGRKVVRLTPNEEGERLYKQSKSVRASKQNMSRWKFTARIRGEEMMAGPERVQLENITWGERWSEDLPPNFREDNALRLSVVEVTMEPGDALFIPKHWWHSVKGIGKGITASANWWFR